MKIKLKSWLILSLVGMHASMFAVPSRNCDSCKQVPLRHARSTSAHTSPDRPRPSPSPEPNHCGPIIISEKDFTC